MTDVFTINSGNQEQIDVNTLARSKIGTHAVTMTIGLTYPAGETFSETITFSVTIIDPCLATTLNAIAPGTLTVTNGLVGAITFNDITDTVEVAKAIDTLGLSQSGTYV